MHLSLRTRLLALVLVGVIVVAAASAASSIVSLGRLRDRALENDAAALQRQAELYTQELVASQALRLDGALATVLHLAETGSGFLAQFPPAADPASAPVFTLAAPIDRPMLESLLPALVRASPEAVRASFITPSGLRRTYPPLNIERMQPDWKRTTRAAFELSQPGANPGHTVRWLPAHPALDTDEQVVSAVAPVYINGRHSGALMVDVSLERLARYLDSQTAGAGRTAFIVGPGGTLIAGPEEAQRLLLGRPMARDETDKIKLATANPALEPLVQAIQRGAHEPLQLQLGGRDYIAAYSPVTVAGWNLVLAAPLDEVAASSARSGAAMRRIAAQTIWLNLAGAFAAFLVLGAVLAVVLQRQFTAPLTALVGAARDIAAGALPRVPVRRNDELGELAAAFNAMTEALEASRAETAAAHAQLEQKVEERTRELAQAMAEAERLNAEQQALLRTLRAVSTPVIPVLHGVLAMPLIGQFDTERARQATREVLARIERDRARTIILDVTGMPIVDTAVARALLETIHAARLLGAEVVLVGVTPEVAQTMVTLGIDLGDVRTALDVQSVVERLRAAGAAARARPAR
jgi:anti-anti-sigma factor